MNSRNSDSVEAQAKESRNILLGKVREILNKNNIYAEEITCNNINSSVANALIKKDCSEFKVITNDMTARVILPKLGRCSELEVARVSNTLFSTTILTDETSLGRIPRILVEVLANEHDPNDSKPLQDVLDTLKTNGLSNNTMLFNDGALNVKALRVLYNALPHKRRNLLIVAICKQLFTNLESYIEKFKERNANVIKERDDIDEAYENKIIELQKEISKRDAEIKQVNALSVEKNHLRIALTNVRDNLQKKECNMNDVISYINETLSGKEKEITTGDILKGPINKSIDCFDDLKNPEEEFKDFDEDPNHFGNPGDTVMDGIKKFEKLSKELEGICTCIRNVGFYAHGSQKTIEKGIENDHAYVSSLATADSFGDLAKLSFNSYNYLKVLIDKLAKYINNLKYSTIKYVAAYNEILREANVNSTTLIGKLESKIGYRTDASYDEVFSVLSSLFQQSSVIGKTLDPSYNTDIPSASVVHLALTASSVSLVPQVIDIEAQIEEKKAKKLQLENKQKPIQKTDRQITIERKTTKPNGKITTNKTKINLDNDYECECENLSKQELFELCLYRKDLYMERNTKHKVSLIDNTIKCLTTEKEILEQAFDGSNAMQIMKLINELYKDCVTDAKSIKQSAAYEQLMKHVEEMEHLISIHISEKAYRNIATMMLLRDYNITPGKLISLIYLAYHEDEVNKITKCNDFLQSTRCSSFITPLSLEEAISRMFRTLLLYYRACVDKTDLLKCLARAIIYIALKLKIVARVNEHASVQSNNVMASFYGYESSVLLTRILKKQDMTILNSIINANSALTYKEQPAIKYNKENNESNQTNQLCEKTERITKMLEQIQEQPKEEQPLNKPKQPLNKPKQPKEEQPLNKPIRKQPRNKLLPLPKRNQPEEQPEERILYNGMYLYKTTIECFKSANCYDESLLGK